MIPDSELVSLLTVRRESDSQDYKRGFPPPGQKNCNFLDLLTDIVAMANSGGGVIVFGVDNENFEPVGLPKQKPLDETTLRQAIQTYLDAPLQIELSFLQWENKDFAFLQIAPYFPLYFMKPAQCVHCGEKSAARHFHPGVPFRRVGSSTVKATPEWMRSQYQKLSGQTGVRPKVENNLPSRHLIYDHFIGRATTIDEVIDLLRDIRRRVTWIRGSGGIGKTALAYRVAEKVLDDPAAIGGVDYIVWVSAKENALTLDGIESRVPTLVSVSDIVAAIADTTGLCPHPSGLSKPIQTASDAFQHMNEVMKLTGLLILDNLETIRDNEIHRFISGLPGETRALATARTGKPGAVMAFDKFDAVVLEPLSIGEAEELIRAEAIRTGNEWLLQDATAILEIIKLSGRIPLAIRLSVPRINCRKALNKYKSEAPEYHNEILDFCYHETFKQLRRQEREVLFILASFNEGQSFGTLAFMHTSLHPGFAKLDDLEHILSGLWHHSLVVIRQHGPEVRYEMHPLVREFATTKLATEVELKHRLLALKEKRDNDLRKEASRLPETVRDTYKRTGDYRAALTVIQDCAQQDETVIEAYLTLAEVCMNQEGELDHAEESAKKARALSESRSLTWNRAQTQLARVAMMKSRFLDAVQLLHQVVGARHANLELDCMISDCYLQQAAQRRDSNKARAEYQESASYARKAVQAAHRAKRVREEGAALTLWARAAIEYNPAIAYQAADAALKLGPENADELIRIRDLARSELRGPPKEDLLDLA